MNQNTIMNIRCKYCSIERAMSEQLFSACYEDGRIDLCRIAFLCAIADMNGKPFYAHELYEKVEEYFVAISKWQSRFDVAERGISGGIMGGLSLHGLVKGTGKTQEVMMLIRDDIYRKIEIKQWKANFTQKDLEKALESIVNL